MPKQREIALLKQLLAATCRSADRLAAADREGGSAYERVALEQLADDCRALLLDLVRCLLLREVPVLEVRHAVTSVHAAPHGDAGGVVAGINHAEGELRHALRQALSKPGISEPIQELLSIHYLRLELHHGDVAAAQPVIGADPVRSLPRPLDG